MFIKILYHLGTDLGIGHQLVVGVEIVGVEGPLDLLHLLAPVTGLGRVCLLGELFQKIPGQQQALIRDAIRLKCGLAKKLGQVRFGQ